MRRATITLPDDLADTVDAFIEAQAVRPSLTALVQTALERYLTDTSTSTSLENLLHVLHNRAEIKRIVASHGAANPRVFGSTARLEATGQSDVDLLVDVRKGTSLFDLAAMQAELERVLDVEVDVVASSGLEGEARARVLAEALPL